MLSAKWKRATPFGVGVAGWSLFDRTFGVIDMVAQYAGLIAAFLPTIGFGLMAGAAAWIMFSIKDWVQALLAAKKNQFYGLQHKIFNCKEKEYQLIRSFEQQHTYEDISDLTHLFSKLYSFGIPCPDPGDRELCIKFLIHLGLLAESRNLKRARGILNEINEAERLAGDSQQREG